MKDPFLHIYAQPFWHQEAFIVGNREALEYLRDAINSALAEEAGSADAFAADGEGYEIKVYKEEGEEFWNKALLPYTDEKMFVVSTDAISPWNLFRKHKDAASQKDDKEEN